jgi:hypothetical protein
MQCSVPLNGGDAICPSPAYCPGIPELANNWVFAGVFMVAFVAGALALALMRRWSSQG